MLSFLNTTARYEMRYVLNRLGARSRFAEEKYFCIGMMKTGTSSFASAMRALGFRHLTFSPYLFSRWYKQGRLDKILYHALSFDSFDDIPYNNLHLMEMVRQWFPNAKFILLERDVTNWAESFRAEARKHGRDLKESNDQLAHFYEGRRVYVDSWIKRYGLEKRLLWMNIIDGDGYEKLCPFVGRPLLHDSFPNLNARPTTRDERSLDADQGLFS